MWNYSNRSFKGTWSLPNVSNTAMCGYLANFEGNQIDTVGRFRIDSLGLRLHLLPVGLIYLRGFLFTFKRVKRSQSFKPEPEPGVSLLALWWLKSTHPKPKPVISKTPNEMSPDICIVNRIYTILSWLWERSVQLFLNFKLSWNPMTNITEFIAPLFK